MGKSRQDIEVLCEKYVDHTISEEEIVVMLDYFKANGIPDTFDHALRAEFLKTIGEDPSKEIADLTNRVKLKLTSQIASKNKRIPYRWLACAAAVLITGIVGLSWFFYSPKAIPDEYMASEIKITPGGNKATIRLADGSVIDLNDHDDGIIMNGQEISYHDGASPILELDTSSLPSLITLTTPRGGIYKVTLSDGTSVWLNAGSTLKYPARFNGAERVVQLEGEAYFDVKRVPDGASAHNLQPFKVVSAKQTIAVLGTEFNVTAYADEDETKTTLIDGKVRLESVQARESMMLLPGEQGKIGKGGLEKSKVDVDDYIDWKNGEFVFRNETAKNVLNRIARWYDIDIEYASYVSSGEVFSGSISRYSDLQTVLDIMQEADNLAFEIKGRTVIVRNKPR